MISKQEAEQPGAASPDEGFSLADEPRALQFRPVRDLDETMRAWALVYHSYLMAGLIGENPLEIHTVPSAIRPESLVVIGTIRDDIGATITCYPDLPGTLPLDTIYPMEMAALRAEGGVLTEVGLLADRRVALQRSIEAKLDLLRWVFFYGVQSGQTHRVIGVHPHHAKFYERMFGFEAFSTESTCPFVNHAPVIGLQLDLQRALDGDRPPRGIRHFKQDPLGPGDYEGRYRFLAPEAVGTPVLEFLRRKSFVVPGVDPLCRLDSTSTAAEDGSPRRAE